MFYFRDLFKTKKPSKPRARKTSGRYAKKITVKQYGQPIGHFYLTK